MARPKAANRSWPGRLAVIDIGSNSIRLVVYDKLGRWPKPIFNEKVLCGLGRDLALTGRLSPEGVTMALTNLKRFRSLIDGMEVGRVDVLATAAVREADDGARFTAEVERLCDLQVKTISGAEEARLSAMGVLSAMPDADGVMGDLGGGSLELVGLNKGQIENQITLPLGPFRLMSAMARGRKPVDFIEQALAGEEWLKSFRKRTFYPVGGAWRSIAKLHLAVTDHPIHVIQEYTVPTAELRDTVSLIARQSRDSLSSL
ncbi:MAG: Ppx/GppA family phosphatase, partial [Pseudomonadota bacterium]